MGCFCFGPFIIVFPGNMPLLVLVHWNCGAWGKNESEANMVTSPSKLFSQFARRVLDLDWRVLLLILLPLSLLVYASLYTISSAFIGGATFVTSLLRSIFTLMATLLPESVEIPPAPSSSVACDESSEGTDTPTNDD